MVGKESRGPGRPSQSTASRTTSPLDTHRQNYRPELGLHPRGSLLGLALPLGLPKGREHTGQPAGKASLLRSITYINTPKCCRISLWEPDVNLRDPTLQARVRNCTLFRQGGHCARSPVQLAPSTPRLPRKADKGVGTLHSNNLYNFLYYNSDYQSGSQKQRRLLKTRLTTNAEVFLNSTHARAHTHGTGMRHRDQRPAPREDKCLGMAGRQRDDLGQQRAQEPGHHDQRTHLGAECKVLTLDKVTKDGFSEEVKSKTRGPMSQVAKTFPHWAPLGTASATSVVTPSPSCPSLISVQDSSPLRASRMEHRRARRGREGDLS